MSDRDEEDVLPANDPLLAQLLEAANEADRAIAVERLIIEHVGPTIDRMLARHRYSSLRREDVDDLRSTVVLRLVRRFRDLAERDGVAIVQLADYVAVLTANAVYDFFRRRFPERTRLKNRVRYVVTHDARFAVTTTAAGLVCSLQRWSSPSKVATNIAISRERATAAMLDSRNLAAAVEAILDHVARPALLDDVVRITADLWNLGEGRPLLEPQVEQIRRTDAFETRQYLEILWQETRALRDAQRTALLLNLRDPAGGNALALFLITGIATFEEIAAAVGLTVEDLAVVWNDLPVDDLRIAERLTLTRQQVINLRKSARERLARRMAAKGRKQ